MILDDALAAVDPVVVFERAFGLVPHTWQLDYLRETRPTVCLKGRQIGASLAAAALCIYEAIYNPNSLSAIVSPSLNQSKEICTRARHGLAILGISLAQDSASTLRLKNGSRILSLPGTARSVRGFAAQLVVLDEAAFIGPETWTAAMPLIAATNGRLVVQSTPGAANGDFYEAVQSTDPGWARYVIRSDEVPTISREFLESKRRGMTAGAYQAEFECQFERLSPSMFPASIVRSLILEK